jgi:hypothetical protein
MRLTSQEVYDKLVNEDRILELNDPPKMVHRSTQSC